MLRFCSALLLTWGIASTTLGAFSAGVASIDVTPEKYPVIINCGFVEGSATSAKDRLHARALVIDDGSGPMAMVIVDSCMMPREFIDPVKKMITEEMGIPSERQLIAATHTHTAPAVMGCLGSDPDPVYGAFLERQIVAVVRKAKQNLRPAKFGWQIVNAAPLTNNRRWILRSDKVRNDPFGQATVRANMHPGYENPDFVGPSGPIDPWLSVISIRTADDKPMAVFSNFSMHYYGAAPVSADYFGKVCGILESKLRANSNNAFVALHSQGTSGDLHWMDYGKPQNPPGLDRYAGQVAAKIDEALGKIEHRSDITVAMAEAKISLGRRLPNEERLAWARKLTAELMNRKPKTQPEIYAREAMFLHNEPRRELKLQSVRIGDLVINAIPNEVYALTGLKLRAVSPLPCFNIELANGAEGYIPPREQHVLGGYTTWPARSAGLEVAAESQIVTTLTALIARVTGKGIRSAADPVSDAYAQEIVKSNPKSYWRLGDWKAPQVTESISGKHGTYEPGIVFGFDGPVQRPFQGFSLVNRSAQFSGGRATLPLPELTPEFSLECWCWNGFPTNARDWTGTIWTLAAKDTPVQTLALGGKKGTAGVLAVTGGGEPASAKSVLPLRQWVHVAVVQKKNRQLVYVNGNLEVDIPASPVKEKCELILGGRSDRTFGWEGRLAEVAFYDRALGAEEIQGHIKASK